MRSAAFVAVLLAAAASSANAETLRVKFDVTSLDGKHSGLRRHLNVGLVWLLPRL